MIDLQLLLVLVVTSGLLVQFASRLFTGNPSTRRLFIPFASLALLLVPALMLISSQKWQLPVLAADTSSLQHLQQPLANGILFALSSVAALLGVLILVHARRERRALRVLTEIVDPTIQRTLTVLCQELKLQRPIRICLGREACSAGGRKPTIVLPANWHTWPKDTLRCVLTHELVHITRHDDLLLIFQRLVSASLWWLPWMRTLVVLLEDAIEESCDDHAATLQRNPVVYLEGLVSAAIDRHNSEVRTLPALARCHLLIRTRRFLGHRDFELNSRGLFWSMLTTTLLLATTSTFELRAANQPQAKPARIVAIAKPTSSQIFSIKLAHEERGPPSPIRH